MAILSKVPEATFVALRHIRETALVQFDSLFTPGRKIWSLENLKRFHSLFVDRFDIGAGTFLEKWRKQLEGASDDIFQLAAELLYVQQFFTSVTGPERKLENVRAVLTWCQQPPLIPSWAADGLSWGLARDQSFNQHRPFHLGWLDEYLIHWQELSENERSRLLNAPWLFANDVRSVEFSRGAHQPMQEAWLYMMFPDNFENISSRTNKRQIREAFKGLLENGQSNNIDFDLSEIRKRLTPEYGDGFHFYRSPIAQRWQQNTVADEDLDTQIRDKITRRDILDAIAALDRDEPHEFGPSTFYDLLEGGRRYPPKAVVGLAARRALGRALRPDEFSGGQESWAFRLLRDRGFQIVDKERSPNAVQTGFEQLLATYSSVRGTVVFGQHGGLKTLLNQLRSSLERLPALRAHPRIRVSWSVGQGNYARIPWIALMDERETTSTQRGVYCVFLFPEDMSGIYLTLMQGVTTTIDEKGRTSGRLILRSQADAIRQTVRVQLDSFSLSDDLDLHTDGALGQDYEAGTIAYRHYSKDAIPKDDVLNADLGQLLIAYDQILRQRPVLNQKSTQWWIFQANPKLYNIDAAIRDLPELTWTVKHEALRASVGDRVFFWRAGREAGVIALGTIIEPPTDRENLPAEEQYVLNLERLGGTQSRVLVRVDQRLDEPLLRTVIAADPRLKELMILRFANYSTFKLPPHHADTIQDLIDNIEQPPPDHAVEADRRTWVYAPGENAEYWDEFYERGIMAIGWDSLGDLTQYGSLEDMLVALQQNAETEARPTNNARTCYDFTHTLRIGDRIFVKRGRNTIIGYGVVTGDYEHRTNRAQFKNVRAVRWEGRGTWTSPAPVAIKTLTDVTDDASFVVALEQMISGAISEAPKPIPAAVREPYTIEHAIEGLFIEEMEFRRSLATWRLKKNLILQGPPGVGKSFIARRLAYALMGYRDPSRVRTVQFHQSYSYEDFVQGYRPSGAGLTLQKGVFLEFCEKALADPNEVYVFTIDEINRGNLSKILGELMLLIEPDKRSPEWATKLAYAPAPEERFYVPPNVYLLGMMNTADRSLSFVDYALRRRFAFVTLHPQYSSSKFFQYLVSQGAAVELVDRIVSRMSSLNEDIAEDKTNLGHSFCIGHSFFSSATTSEPLNEAWYQRVIDTEIMPLLEEYWFDNPDRVSEWHKRLMAE